MAKRSKRKLADHSEAEQMLPDGLMVLLRIALIIGVGLWVYSPAFHGDWLWDDDWYITANPLVRTTAGLWSFWFHPGVWVEYYPIHETLIWIEWQLFGTDTLGYHLITVALHVVNALLVWRLLAKFGLRKAWIGGLLFAVHPVCVDSVAWIVETKNTLSLLPFLLAMMAWIDYDEKTNSRDYALALGLFLVAMLCKMEVAPFPVVLLLYAWWKRRRIAGRDLIASLPFFVISIVLGLLTLACGNWYFLDHYKLDQAVPLDGVWARTALIGQTLTVYFAHCFWPVGLLPIYPRWPIDNPSLLQFLPWPILGLVAFWLWRRRSGWGAHAILGLGFFVLFLLPFLGFITTTFMISTWLMDHFLYVPLIGIIGLIVAAYESIEQRLPDTFRLAATGTLTIVISLLTIESHAYASVYSDEATLWSYTLEHNPRAWLAHYNLGNALFLAGDLTQATDEYRLAVAYNPNSVMAHNNLGIALAQQNQLHEAKAQFEAALKLAPHFSSPENNLAKVELLLNEAPPKQ